MTFGKNIKNFFLQKNNQLKIKTDIHSHLIPFIDDGSNSLEESIDLIKGLIKIGYERLILTPHINKIPYPNTRDSVLKKFEIFYDNIIYKDLNIQMGVAGEYFFDDAFIKLVEKDELLTFGDKHILFEFSFAYPPANFKSTIFKLLDKGYKPVLAHPERFFYLAKNFDRYTQLKELNILFQININSLSGYYSQGVKKTTQKLIECGYVDFLGTDTHHQKHINSLNKSIEDEYYAKIFQNNFILNDALRIN